VGQAQSNGYHQIRSLICPLGLSDRINIELERSTKSSGKTIVKASLGKALLEHQSALGNSEWLLQELNSERNLVSKAIGLFREIETDFNVLVELKKNIPVQAGLGGGSSNAAAVLGFLNEHVNQSGGPSPEIVQLAAKLGSDVAAFLEGSPVFISSFGEEVFSLEGLNLSCPWLVLVKPPWGQKTGAAYAQLDESREGKEPKFETSCSRTELEPFGFRSGEAFLEAPIENSNWLPGLFNDFQAPILNGDPRFDFVSRFSDLLDSRGCRLLLAGSGSTLALVGLENQEAALELRDEILEDLPVDSWHMVTHFEF